MSPEDQQTKEVLAVPPPPIEQWENSPVKEDRFGDTIRWASEDAFGKAWEKFSKAGQVAVSADDPRLLTALKQTNQYIADMFVSGLYTVEGAANAAAGAIGEVFGGSPESEKRLARDIKAMPEAFAGSGFTRGANQLDDIADTAVTSLSQGYNKLSDVVDNMDRNTLYTFGGYFNAKNPGVSSKGELLPTSEGADFLKRFEIDDSAAVFKDQSGLTSIRGWKGVVPDTATKLGDFLEHEELFYQYPDLRDINLVVDKNMAHNELGWALENTLALNQNIVNTELGKKTLIHEIQHAIQKREGFAEGSDPSSAEVFKVASLDVDSPENIKQWDNWIKDWEAYEDPHNTRIPAARFLISVEEFAKQKGLTLNELARLDSPSILDRFRKKLRGKPDSELLRLSADVKLVKGLLNSLDTDKPVDFNYARGVVNDAYETLNTYLFNQKIPQEDIEKFLDLPEGNGYGQRPFERFFPEPELPNTPAPGQLSQNTNYLHKVYERKKGEAEARNAANRLTLSLEQRFKIQPEDTEDVPRSIQWDDSDFYVPPEKLFKQGYEQGGMVEDDQMERLMQEGGITDDGMKREPVTGNEIPPGSLAEEVRDNIPAQLSAGEYVVPADVVRFFGVKFFEDLRNAAKEGLQNMEQDGRIGGTAVSDEGIPLDTEEEPEYSEEELTPEEAQMLRDALGANTGMAEGGVVQGYAAGGFNRQSFSSADYAQPSLTYGGFETKEYYNPDTKERRSFMFYNGSPVGNIPSGFVPYTEETTQVTEETEVTPVTGTASTERGGGSERAGVTPTGDRTPAQGNSYEGWADENRDAISSDPLGFGEEALGRLSEARTKAGGLLGGAVAGPLGSVAGAGLAEVGPLSDAKAASEIAKGMGLDTTELDIAIDKEQGLFGDILGALGIGTGVKKATAFFDLSRPTTTVTTPPSQSESGYRDITESGVGYREYGSDGSGGYSSRSATGSTAPSETISPRDRPSDLDTTSNPGGGTESGGTDVSGNRDAGSPRDDRYSGRGEGMAKGGLVSKPKSKSRTTTKTKRKGLASS